MAEPVPLSPARRLARLFRRLVAFGLFLLLGLSIVLYALQTNLIFPGAATQGTPVAHVVPPPGCELVRLSTARGERVVALFGPALTARGEPHPDAARQPTLLFFDGNGMCLSRSAEDALDRFRRLGANVLIPDYVGYGLSGGEPSESGCYRTADAVLAYLKGRPDVDPKSIVAAGRSLGGAVAIDLAAREDLAGLAVFSTFTRMSEMARKQFPIPLLPVDLLLKHRFDSIDKIPLIRGPILLGHGRADGLVPCEMAGRLAAAAQAPATVFIVDEADHNDLFEVGEAEVFARLDRFLEDVRRRTATSAPTRGRDGVAEDP